MSSMKQSGRVSLLALLSLVCLVLVAGVLMFSQEGLGTVGTRFMGALASGDVDQLTKLTYLGNRSQEDIKKAWTFTTTVPGQHYFFRWHLLDSRQADATSGSVRVAVERNIGSGGSYDENYGLQMVKVGPDNQLSPNGTWKVDVGGINREMYPGLPR